MAQKKLKKIQKTSESRPERRNNKTENKGGKTQKQKKAVTRKTND
jgi:hypothetical protein